MSEYDKNIRKKKHFQSPREFTPRKTVILAKNDRESRDIDKEKRDKPTIAEKEKPPVIMIKVREPSTTKDIENRPQSPKKISGKENESDTQIIQPVKIAQNESKEKKITENKLLLQPTPMSCPIKLIDEYMEFLPIGYEYLQDTNTNFLVVGIIGGQSVGKSTIMNILAHSNDLSNICDEILNSDKVEATVTKYDTNYSEKENNSVLQPIDNNVKLSNSSESTNKTKTSPLVFKCQSMDQIETGQTCTSGVDLYITNSRVILLDTGAIGGGGNGWTVGGLGSNMIGKSGLEVPAFLLAVCHVVILVQDWFVDLNMLRYVQSAEMVKPSIPASSNVNQTNTHSSSGTGTSQDVDSSKDYHPHLLFLQNKCTLDDFKPQSVKLMQDLYRKAFCKSKMHIDSGMFLYDADCNDNSFQIDGMFHNLNAEMCGKPLNLFLMPSVTEDNDNVYEGHPTVEELANRLRWTVFGASRNQLTNVQLTEKSWLHYCCKTWDNIKKSTFFIEYNRLLP